MWQPVVYLCALTSVTTMTATAAAMNSEDAARANTRFSLDLLKQILAQQQQDVAGATAATNVFFSPFSISAALAMTSLGARGNTLKEINKVFHFDEMGGGGKEPYALHRAYGKIMEEYSGDGKNFTLSSAMKLFADNKFPITEKFDTNVRDYYTSDVEKVAFASGNAEAIVNDWVKQQTRDKIPELFKPGSFSQDTKLVIANAVYFKGDWEKSFKEEHTKRASFHLDSGKEQDVDMMTADNFFRHTRDDENKFKAVQLPYLGQRLVMVIILPDEMDGLEQVVESLDDMKLETILKNTAEMRLHVELPKFKIAADYSHLKTQLCRLGLRDLFDGRLANLSGISSVPLVVNQIAHKAVVEVTEQGTEAAAATGIDIMLRSKPQEFKVNRPFYFGIFDTETSMVLFNGVVRDVNTDVATAESVPCERLVGAPSSSDRTHYCAWLLAVTVTILLSYLK